MERPKLEEMGEPRLASEGKHWRRLFLLAHKANIHLLSISFPCLIDTATSSYAVRSGKEIELGEEGRLVTQE